MSTMLFISLARHQGLYFAQLLAATGLAGKVVTAAQLPFPRSLRLRAQVDWQPVIAEKCAERRVKHRSEGILYRLALRLELWVMALRMQALFERERPATLVLWNGAHRYCRLLVALAPPGCTVFFFENGLLPNTTTLDAKGVNFLNSVPRCAQFYRDYHSRYAAPASPPPDLIPRAPRVPGIAQVELPERFVFIPFQDDRDTQVRLFSPWIGNMADLFDLGERLQRETGLTVVFKEHPSSPMTYPQLHARTHDYLFFANGNSTQELIERCEYVVTINSTVGLESVLLGKPVMTLGQAFFNIDGLVVHADDAVSALRQAKAYPQWSLEEPVRQGFLNYLTREYCIPGRWQDAEPAHLQAVAERLRQGAQ